MRVEPRADARARRWRADGQCARGDDQPMWGHTPYYPGARKLCIRVTGDRTTSRLLGAQLLGPSDAEIDKRIDVYATALFNSLSVDAVNDLDLSYTPPFGTPWDAVQKWGPGVGTVNPGHERSTSPHVRLELLENALATAAANRD